MGPNKVTAIYGKINFPGDNTLMVVKACNKGPIDGNLK